MRSIRAVNGAEYEIVVRGRMGGALVRWFDDLEVCDTGPDITALRGWFADQSALQGVLGRLGEVGLELVSVHRVDQE